MTQPKSKVTKTPRAPRKAGNPPGSKWRSTPNDLRHRKRTEFTLSAEALAEVERLAALNAGNRSAGVDALLLASAAAAAAEAPTKGKRR